MTTSSRSIRALSVNPAASSQTSHPQFCSLLLKNLFYNISLTSVVLAIISIRTHKNRKDLVKLDIRYNLSMGQWDSSRGCKQTNSSGSTSTAGQSWSIHFVNFDGCLQRIVWVIILPSTLIFYSKWVHLTLRAFSPKVWLLFSSVALCLDLSNWTSSVFSLPIRTPTITTVSTTLTSKAAVNKVHHNSLTLCDPASSYI